MRTLFSYLVLTPLLMATIVSCAKRPTDESVAACSVDFGWVDSSSIHPKDAAYTKLLTDLTSKGFPGISVMISDDKGTWYKASGLADIDNDIKMQPCHIAKTASVTKMFTAVMIYKLVAAGKVALDDKISMYIDAEHISKIKNSELATVRDLLRHSSGIYDVVFDADFILYTFNNLDKEKSYEKMLSFAYGKEPAFAYNTKRDYNQTLNHVLLAMIVNKVTGADQSVYMRDQIFTPLQMTSSYLRPQDDIPWNKTAKGYYDYRTEGVLQDLTPLFTGDGRGFTGVYTNPNDLRKMTNALYKDKNLISSDMYNSMIQIDNIDSNMECAGGCRAVKYKVDGADYIWYGHPGGEVNYAAGMFYCPQKNATVTFIANYGVAFTTLGIHTDAYYAFRKKLLEEVSRN